MTMSPWRFAAMVATSTGAMYALTYVNTHAHEHVFWSETRAWMAVVMGSSMAGIMLGFMRHMYAKRARLAIAAVSAATLASALWLVRAQATVDDIDYMKAMIPHHSIAILTSRRSQLSDPRVRKLAEFSSIDYS